VTPYSQRIEIVRAYLADRGPNNLRPNGGTPKRREGLRHEARTHEALYHRYGDLYLNSPWFFIRSPRGAFHYAQPDGLLFFPDRGLLAIVEAKLKHVATSYYQTENLYLPVVRRVFPGWSYSVCEVVRWYDVSTPFPIRHRVVKEIHDTQPDEFTVHILRNH
jgi:hypothetical protein